MTTWALKDSRAQLKPPEDFTIPESWREYLKDFTTGTLSAVPLTQTVTIELTPAARMALEMSIKSNLSCSVPCIIVYEE